MFESSLQQIIEKKLLDMQRYNFKMEKKKEYFKDESTHIII